MRTLRHTDDRNVVNTGVFHHLSLRATSHTCTIAGNLLHTYAPYYVSPTTTGVVNAGNLVINKPAVAGGVLANDILVASIAFAGNPTITAPGSWTLVQRSNNATAPAMGVAVSQKRNSERDGSNVAKRARSRSSSCSSWAARI